MNDQTAKADAGKPRLTLVPRQIITDIAIVRGYGDMKYGSSDNWKTVDIERYKDAAYRHFMAYLDDPHGVDKESGLPHLWHCVCNFAFICEMEKGKFGNVKMKLPRGKEGEIAVIPQKQMFKWLREYAKGGLL